MVRVKICGITNLQDARYAVDVGADALGFVFAPSARQITPERVRRIVKSIGPFVNFVGVFVDEDLQVVERVAQYCGLDTIQLHGSESPRYLSSLTPRCRVVKAIRVKGKIAPDRLKRYRASAYLLDTYDKKKMGGTGRTSPQMWAVARRAVELGIAPIILAGGLNPGNVVDAIKVVRPFAVDVSSGVELRPGKKDKCLVREFIKAVKDSY